MFRLVIASYMVLHLIILSMVLNSTHLTNTMLRGFSRKFCSSFTRYNGVIERELKSSDAILKFLRTPTGCVHDVIPKLNSDSIVDEAVVKKMLLLSGLEAELSPEHTQKWIEALNTQLGFINHLRDLDPSQNETEKTTLEVFRLLETDHHPQKKLTLTDLERAIEVFNDDATAENSKVDFDAKRFIRSTIMNMAQGPTKG